MVILCPGCCHFVGISILSRALPTAIWCVQSRGRKQPSGHPSFYSGKSLCFGLCFECVGSLNNSDILFSRSGLTGYLNAAWIRPFSWDEPSTVDE